MIAQTTMIRYGVLMANRDIELPQDFGAASPAKRITLGCTLLPSLRPARDPTTTSSPSFRSPERISTGARSRSRDAPEQSESRPMAEP